MEKPTQPAKVNESKALPFEVTKGWTAIPNALLTVYTRHPEMKASYFLVYLFLLERYNGDYGYAFPTEKQIADHIGVSASTVKRAIQKLKYVGLINVVKSHEHNNNRYTFPKPIESLYEFEEQYPEVTAHMKKLAQQEEKRAEEAEKDLARLEDYYKTL